LPFPRPDILFLVEGGVFGGELCCKCILGQPGNRFELLSPEKRAVLSASNSCHMEQKHEGLLIGQHTLYGHFQS
jgi:hypothetical protein